MDQGSSPLNPSSLIDLKAELHKKYESFKKAKLSSNHDRSKQSAFKCKGQQLNTKTEKRIPIVKTKEDPEEEEALKKSRLALEAKTRLYENIVSNKILIDDEQNESYMVNFQKKVLSDSTSQLTSEAPNPTEASNELTHDESKAFYEDYSVIGKSKDECASPAKPLDPDQPIHYQNVQFNEVRDHGTGYFAFSMDETKRKEQMEELNSLRQNTENQIALKQRLLKKRKAIIQNRLAKICERKNIDKSALKAFDDGEDEKQPDTPTPVIEEEPPPPKKEPKVRPWDIGKETLQQFVPEKRKIQTQNDWIQEKREERESEFAPPSFYK